MENREIEINFHNYINEDVDCLKLNKIRYNIGKYAVQNKIMSKSIRDFGSLALTVLGKLILPKFVSVPIAFLASYIAIDQFIIDCKKYYCNQEMRNRHENLVNVDNELNVEIERDILEGKISTGGIY